MAETNKSVELDLSEVVLLRIQLYYTPILVYLGSMGNCLSVCVFFGTKLRRSSSSIYLGALAISDTGFLISVFVVWLNLVGIRLFNKYGFCQFFIYLTTLCSFLSVWFVVAFTVERFIAVRYPLQRQSMCTAARAKVTVAGLTGLGMLLCSPVLWFSGLREHTNEMGRNETQCDLAEGWESSATVFNVVDTLLTFAVPFTVIVILNALIAKAICRLARVRRTLTTDSNNLQDKQCASQSPRSGLVQQTKITKMLLVVSTAFLCFNLPAYVVRVTAFLHKEESTPKATVLAQQLCYLLFNTNFGINFVLYCATGQNFRKAIMHIFCRPSPRRNTTTGHTSHHRNQALELTRGTTDPTSHQRTTVLTQSCKDTHELQVFSA